MQWTEKTRRVKFWLVVIAIMIAVAALLASHYLVRDLQREEQGKMYGPKQWRPSTKKTR